MCARYTLTVDLTQLQRRFSFVAENLPYAPRYNVAPTQQVLALINDGRMSSRHSCAGD